ncbi:MAG: BatA domain-containing protein [Bacteroidales bacterium]|nr:BatA domain-containing protein [Bacteroidales bacterium]
MFFANPLFLIGMVAVAVPVLVHLFSFRRYRKVYFSNVERIAELRDETQRQSRLRQLLLLAARILTIVFLVLAFAQPTLPLHNGKHHVGNTAVSIYVDNSFSMLLESSEGSVLHDALQKARETAAAYRPSDRFQLLTNDMGGSQFRWLSRDEFLLALDEVEASPRSRLLSDVFHRQTDFLAQSHADNRHAYIISDMQASVCDINSFSADSSVLLTLVPVESQDVSNVSIDSVVLNAPAYNRGSDITIRVSLTHVGGGALEKQPLRLYVNGQQRAMSTVDIPDGHGVGNASADIHFVADQEGVMDCYVETADHAITFDDRFYFSINVVSSTEVVSIGADNKSLRQLFGTDSTIRFRHMNGNAIDYASLADCDMLVLNELESVPSGLTQSLHTFVERGGTLLVVPAEKADAKSYEQLLAPMRAPLLGQWSEGDSRVVSLAHEASLYRGVFDGLTADNELPSVKGFYRLTLLPTSVSEPLMTMVDGSPFLSHTTVNGGGHLYVMASPLRSEYGNFVQQALFVPTLFNMALYSRPQPTPFYIIGNEVRLPLSNVYATAPSEVRLRSSGGDYEMIPDIRMLGGHPVMLLYDQPSQPGNYRLLSPVAPEQGLSLNFSRLESAMAFVPRSQLQSAGETILLPHGGSSMTSYVRQLSEGRPLWHWCVWLALLMLAAEVVILRWPDIQRRFANLKERR